MSVSLYDASVHVPVPIHVGLRRPRPGGDLDDEVRPASGNVDWQRTRLSGLNKTEIDWDRHEIDPRWVEFDTADCAAALQPNIFTNHGGRELERFLAGAAERGEMAVLVSLLGFAQDTTPSSFSGPGGDSVYLGATNTVVYGSRLGAKTRVELAPDMQPAEQDLGKRLLNRSRDAPWWGLRLAGTTVEPMTGPAMTYPAEGRLHPILVDPLGQPVVAVWVSPEEQVRWYILPDDIDWKVILDWLIHQALPAYIPQAARRYRTSSFVDTELLTSAERGARQAIADMEVRHAAERQRLEDALADARQGAAPIREGLLYGTGSDLVRAVETVLRAAGFDVVDLDVELGATLSADLLVTVADHRRLVEVKSQGRNASESLVNDLFRHLRTWPELRPELPVGGGALVVNHQHRLPPDQRSNTVYTRREFVDTLTVPVIAVRDLFDSWKNSDWMAIQRAVLGTEPPTMQVSRNEPTKQTETEAPTLAPAVPRLRRRWRPGRRK